MSELDDLDDLEIDLSPARSGSARRIRAGKKMAAQNILGRSHRMPLWKRQLKAEASADVRRENDE